MSFKQYLDEINENRDQIKAAYLKPSYDKNKLEFMMKKGNVYIQFTDTKSRSKLGSGNVIKLTDDYAIIDRDKFGNTDVKVKYDIIQSAMNIKKVNEDEENENLTEASTVNFDDAIIIIKKYFPYISKLERKKIGARINGSQYDDDVDYKFVDDLAVDHHGKNLSKKDFEKIVKADAEKYFDKWRSR